MELWLGPSHHGTTFASDEHRRATWFRYRERLMRRFANNGKRPQGWWWYESPFRSHRHPGTEHERSILYEFTDVLGVEERAELEAFWKREFDRSFDEHFFHCAGPDKIFTGDIAREYHWLWADIPPELVDRWMAERERRGRVIHKLEEGGSPVQQETATEDSA